MSGLVSEAVTARRLCPICREDLGIARPGTDGIDGRPGVPEACDRPYHGRLDGPAPVAAQPKRKRSRKPKRDAFKRLEDDIAEALVRFQRSLNPSDPYDSAPTCGGWHRQFGFADDLVWPWLTVSCLRDASAVASCFDGLRILAGIGAGRG